MCLHVCIMHEPLLDNIDLAQSGIETKNCSWDDETTKKINRSKRLKKMRIEVEDQPKQELKTKRETPPRTVKPIEANQTPEILQRMLQISNLKVFVCSGRELPSL